MKTINASVLLSKIWGLYRGKPATDIDVEGFILLRENLDLSLKEIWESERWRDTTFTEHRQYRATYDSGAANATGTEVYFPPTGKYYLAIRAASNNAPATLTDGSYATNTAFWADLQTSYSTETYVSTKAYAAGDQVLFADDGLQYQCHTASTGNDPTDTGFWGPLVRFNRYIAWEQSWETTAFERGYGVSDDNPLFGSKWKSLPWEESDLGVQVLTAHARVWLKFRKRRPVLQGDTHSLTAAYSSGDQAYFVAASGVGNWYEANQAVSAGETPATDAAKWDAIEIPEVFTAYLTWSTVAKLKQTDQQEATANLYYQRALGALEMMTDDQHRLTGQSPRVERAVY